jgi:hypothetical protein
VQKRAVYPPDGTIGILTLIIAAREKYSCTLCMRNGKDDGGAMTVPPTARQLRGREALFGFIISGRVHGRDEIPVSVRPGIEQFFKTGISCSFFVVLVIRTKGFISNR